MDDSNYKIIMKLLEKQPDRGSMPDEEVECVRHSILAVLSKYGIEADGLDSIVSPSVITIEITLPYNKQASKIRKYAHDIENDLIKHGLCRVIITVPGKNALAIEVPRSDRRMVYLREVLESKEFQESEAELPIALGISTENKPIIADLRKMPHLLIGGATGMGKSVLLNAIIVSLLCRKSPEEVKFMFIAPKIVEFGHYSKIRDQYLVKIEGIDEDIISSFEHVITALNSLCSEMDKRYELFKKTCCRSNRDYNQKLEERELSTTNGHKPMPYIIVVIDEFADLINAYGKAIEIPIARLAQKCRAVGIHLIIATQKTSPQVITGILKANFPARISFKVQNFADSRTILDMTGAQLLLDRGDMLVSNNGVSSRVQGAFIDEPEIERVCVWIAHNNSDYKPYTLPNQSRHEFPALVNDNDPNIVFEQIGKMNVSSDIDNIINWNNYHVSGDIDEIKKIVRAHGIINIGVEDIISTLSTTNTNYITSGESSGEDRVIMALNHAVHKLPVELQNIEKVIVNVWVSECHQILMSAIKGIVKKFGYKFPEIDLIWGVAVDPDINDDDIKITLIAVNKHKLC